MGMSVPPHRPLSGPRTAFAVGGAAAALLIVSAATRAGSGTPSRPPGWNAAAAPAAHAANGLVLALAPLFMLAGIAAILVGQVLARRVRAEQQRLHPRSRWKRLLRWAILIGSVVAFREMVTHGVVHLPNLHNLILGGGGSNHSQSAGAHTAGGGATTTADWSVAAIVWILLAAALVLVVRRHLRRRELATAEPVLQAQAQPGIDYDRLRGIADPREAVIASYAEMERTLAERRLARDPAEAPREYLSRIVHALRRSRSAAGSLTGLYERARFSHHPVGPAMRGQAIDALADVDADVLGQEDA
jgi:hypothetical protein